MLFSDRLFRRRTKKPLAFLLTAILAASLGATGCRDDTAAQLAGSWIGRPAATSAAEGPSGEGSELVVPANTDFSRLDAAVKIDFQEEQQVALELVGSGALIRGQWEIVEATPGFILIEIVTPGEASTTDAGASLVRRRFELEPTYEDDQLVGFVLREDGADRRLGALQFQRASAAGNQRRKVKAPAGQPSPPPSDS